MPSETDSAGWSATGRDVQRDLAGRDSAAPVGDLIAERVRAAPVCCRRVAVAAIGIDRDGAVRGAAAVDGREHQRVAVDVARQELADDDRVFIAGGRCRSRRGRDFDRLQRRNYEATEIERFDVADGIGAGIAVRQVDIDDLEISCRARQAVAAHRAGEDGRVETDAAVDRIAARTAFDAVVAAAGPDVVVARTARNAVVAGTGPEHVVARTAHDGDVARRVVAAGQVDDVVAIAGIDDFDVADAAARRGLRAVAVVEEQRVVAAAERDPVDAGAALEHVVAADLALDGNRLAGTVGDGIADIERRPSAGERAIVRTLQRVVAVAAVEQVGARAAVEHVVAAAAAQRVVARAARKRVVARAAGYAVVACTTRKRHAAIAAGEDVVAGRARIVGRERRGIFERTRIAGAAEQVGRLKIGEADARGRTDEGDDGIAADLCEQHRGSGESGAFETKDWSVRAEPVDDEVLSFPDREFLALGHFRPVRHSIHTIAPDWRLSFMQPVLFGMLAGAVLL